MLSTYNPYRYCGPCRMRLSISAYTEEGATMERAGSPHPWETGPRREVVRVGPLLGEEGPPSGDA